MVKHLCGVMGVSLLWAIIWPFFCPVPVLAMDKMIIPITKQYILNTPDGRVYKKEHDRLKKFMKSVQEARAKHGAGSAEFISMAKYWRELKQKFKQSDAYRRVQQMRAALGHKVICYGGYGDCDPEVFVTNALNQIADTGRVPATMHCISSDPCRDRAPTDADFARAGYSAYEKTVTPVSAQGNMGALFECSCRDSEGGYLEGLGTQGCFKSNPFRNRDCHIGPNTVWEKDSP